MLLKNESTRQGRTLRFCHCCTSIFQEAILIEYDTYSNPLVVDLGDRWNLFATHFIEFIHTTRSVGVLDKMESVQQLIAWLCNDIWLNTDALAVNRILIMVGFFMPLSELVWKVTRLCAQAFFHCTLHLLDFLAFRSLLCSALG